MIIWINIVRHWPKSRDPGVLASKLLILLTIFLQTACSNPDVHSEKKLTIQQAIYDVAHSQDPDALDLLQNAIQSDGQKFSDELLVYYQRSGTIDFVTQFGPYIETLIPELVKGDNSLVRQMAVEVIGILGDPAHAETLILLLKDPDSEVRYAAASALGELGNSIAVMPLINALDDEEIQIAVVGSLGNLGAPEATAAIAQLLNHLDFYVRVSVVKALGKIADTKAYEYLLQAVENESWRVRREIAVSLDEFDHGKKVTILSYLLRDPVYDIRWEALLKITEKKTESTLEPLLYVAANDPSPYLKGIALTHLIDFKRENVFNFVVNELNADNHQSRRAAAYLLGQWLDRRALNPLLNSLGDNEMEALSAKIHSLGLFADPVIIDPVLTKFDVKFWKARRQALVTLEQFKDERIIMPAILRLEDNVPEVKKAAAQVLQHYPLSNVEKALLAALDKEASFARLQMIFSLGEVGSENAIKPLEAYLTHKDQNIVKEARDALVKIEARLK